MGRSYSGISRPPLVVYSVISRGRLGESASSLAYVVQHEQRKIRCPRYLSYRYRPFRLLISHPIISQPVMPLKAICTCMCHQLIQILPPICSPAQPSATLKGLHDHIEIYCPKICHPAPFALNTGHVTARPEDQFKQR